MSNRKRRVGISTNSPLARTGFGRFAKALSEWLYKNRPDYEIYFLHHQMHQDEPNLKRMPYISWGALTNEIINTEQFQKDGNWQRLMAYGVGRAEPFIVDNKLDNLWLSEDLWAFPKEFYYQKDWFQFAKSNVMFHTTVDSEPILTHGKELAENSPNFSVWADFARRVLHEESMEKYGHVKYIPGCLDPSNFKQISYSEREELRKKFGIQSNETIILHLGRSQLRKLFLSNLEALAKFRKQYPEKKLRLYFHCHWSEGWNLVEGIKNYGLTMEDVFTSYCCSKCSYWEARHFSADGIKCPNCGDEKSFATAGVTSTITEQELAKIYSICDGASSPFTSGGLEYFNVESLLMGLPLISAPYSSGEDFVAQPFVESMEGTYYHEVGTNFKKFNPNPNSIVKFFNKIHDMPIEKRKEIGRKGREWALGRFGVDSVARKICEWIDSTPLLDWSQYHAKKADYDIKVPDAPIPQNIESDLEFVLTLYREILKMNQDPSDSGVQGWIAYFKDMPPGFHQERLKMRAQVEQSFRVIAGQENSKNNPVQFKDLIDWDRPNKRGLIVVKESMGDCFVVSSLFGDFHKKYEGYDLYVSTQLDKYREVFEGNPHIHKLIPYHPMVESEMAMIGSGGEQKDSFFHFYGFPAVSTQRHLNYLSHDRSGEIV